VLFESWFLFGLVAVAAWGLSCVIDACFVGEGVYRKPVDGPAVAGLFFLVPVLTADPGDVTGVAPPVLITAFLAGAVLLLHLYLYFRALFEVNDASNAEIFNTLSVIIVPLLAIVALDEVLEPIHYLAVGISAVGILMLLRCDASSVTLRVAALLIASVVSISVVIVMQAWVLQSIGYASAIWWFSLGAFASSAALLIVNALLRRRVAKILRRHGLVIVGVQCLEVAAMLGSQKATDLGPSVTLVVLLECSLPLFVMLFSWVFLVYSRYWRAAGRRNLNKVLATQTGGLTGKLLSLAVIVLAIGLSQSVI
jgi:drug/metabolite transporter (DMT)-like permease